MMSRLVPRAARLTRATDVGARPATAPRPLYNTALLTAASLAAKGCGFALFLVLLRVLKPHGFGDYNNVMAFVGLFAVATDLGLSTLAVRDVAQDRALLPRYLGNVLTLRLILSLLVALACIALARAQHWNSAVQSGIVLWAFALIPISVVGTMGIAFQAVERLGVQSLLTAATAALMAVLGITVVLAGGRVVAVVAVAAGVNLVAAVAALWLASRLAPIRPRIEVAWWPSLVSVAVPFSVLTLLNVLYSNADAVLVYNLKGSGDAGYYGVAYRFVSTLLAVAISPLNAAILPAINRIAAGSHAALQRLVLSGIAITLAVGMPIAAITTIYAREILRLVAHEPQYLAAMPTLAPALQWLAWSFPCFTVLAVVYNALYAVHRANRVAVIFGVTLVFNVGLNVLLIPRYSYLASAALTTLSEALNVALGLWMIRRYVVDPFPAWRAVLKVIAATALMLLAMWLLRPVSLALPLPAGVIVYLAALRLLRAFGAPEKAILSRVPLAGRYAAWL